MISPSSVITIAEKKKALSPARTESDSSVSKTLVLTLPQITVASTGLEFLRRSRTRAASALPPSASSCKRNWLRLKIGEVEPGKQRRLRYAGNNAEPSPESGDGGHGCFLKSLCSRGVFRTRNAVPARNRRRRSMSAAPDSPDAPSRRDAAALAPGGGANGRRETGAVDGTRSNRSRTPY